MNNIVKAASNLETKALPSSVWYPSNAIDFGFALIDRAKMYELMATYQRNPMVHGCIDINAKAAVAAHPAVMQVVNVGAKNLSSRGLKRYNSKKYKKLLKQWADRDLKRKNIGDDEELVEALNTPFAQALSSNVNCMDLNGLVRLTVVALEVFGISFWFKNRDAVGRVVAYQYLPTYNVWPERGEDGHVTKWFYSSTFDGTPKKVEIELEDMLIFRWPSPSDPLASGDSPLMSALRRIDLSGKWLDWQDWLIGNRARPDWVFVPKVPDGATLTQEQVDRTEKKINDKFRGAGNGRAAVVEQAGTIVPLNWTPVDLAPLEFDDKLKDAILFALSIPEAFANNDGNRANLEGSLEQWARQSLAPIVTLIEGVLTSEAALEFDDSLVFAFENVIPMDEAFELELEKFELSKWQLGLQYGGLKDPDYREQVLGLDPLTPEELEAMKPPAPVVVAPEASESSEEAPEDTQGGQDEEEPTKSFDLLTLNKEVAKGNIDRATAISLVAHCLKIDETQAKKLVTFKKRSKGNRSKKTKALPAMKIPSSKGFAATIKKQMDRQKTHYLSQCDGMKSYVEGIDTKASTGLPHGFTSIEDWDAEDQYEYKPYLQVAMDGAADGRVKALTRVGADEDAFSVVPEEIGAAVDHASLKFAKTTNDSTLSDLNDALEALRTEIQEGVETGDSIPLLKKRVQSVFENIADDRAEMIARTETSRAVHEGQKISAKASGIVKGFKFLLSDESCPECQAVADENPEIGLDGKFDPSNTYSDTPIPIHPNCRCTMQEIIDLDALDSQDDDDE